MQSGLSRRVAGYPVDVVDFRVPDVLDPHYVDVNARRVPAEDLVLTPHATIERRFQQACEYGQVLWRELAETRRYLRDQIAGNGDGEADASPALLGDDQSWREWAVRYADVCSALAGTSGDSGFGRSEATLIARSHGVELNQRT